MPVKRLCKTCGRSIIAFSTLENKCYDCKRKTAKPTVRKPINKQGKVTKRWLATREQWFRDNPPNEEGFYMCYLCNKWLDQKETTLDHVIPRSRRPDLRYEMSNLRPCCYECNQEKGSKVY